MHRLVPGGYKNWVLQLPEAQPCMVITPFISLTRVLYYKSLIAFYRPVLCQED